MEKLSKVLAKKFEAEFEKIFQKERTEKYFLPQEQFNSCLERAETAINLATEGIKHDLALMIANHRETKHGDNTMEEQSELLKAGADPEMGAMSFWND